MSERTVVGRAISPVAWFVFLKPVGDMFWNYRSVDFALSAFLVLLLVAGLTTRSVRLGLPDALMIVLAVLLTWSLLRDSNGLVVWLKMLSAILAYFVGRMYARDWERIISAASRGLTVVLIVNCLLAVTGRGFQLWGEARTFSGAFYFKTDLAAVICMALIVIVYWMPAVGGRVVLASTCVVLIILSNARVYYLIVLASGIIYCFYRSGVRIRARLLLLLVGAAVPVLLLLNWLFALPLVARMGLLGIHFDSWSELLDGPNTQGRNVIWTALLERIEESSLPERLFGIDLVSDQVSTYGGVYGSHSLYIGLLYNVGIVGLALFVAWAFLVLRDVIDLQGQSLTEQFKGTLAYFTLSILTMFLLSGISVHVLQFSANTWLPMIVIGLTVSIAREGDLRCISQGTGVSGRPRTT